MSNDCALSESVALDILHRRVTARVASFLPDFLLDIKPESGITSPFHLVYGTPMMEYHNTVCLLCHIISPETFAEYSLQPEGKKTVDVGSFHQFK